MNHSILIQFTTTKPLPKDFTDLVADRVYRLDLVEKKECVARVLSEEEVNLLKEQQ